MFAYIKPLVFLFCFLVSASLAQETVPSATKKSENPLILIKGTIINTETNAPIFKANVESSQGAYATTNSVGEFSIKTRIGEKLIVRHQDFETQYFTIKDNNYLELAVNPLATENDKSKSFRSLSFSNVLESAKESLTIDAKKSIQFITVALTKSMSEKQDAEAYEVLGDVYYYWKQYDLAVLNYNISLGKYISTQVRFKLAESYKRNKNYQESFEVYNTINVDQLSNNQKIDYYEKLGDTYYAIKEYDSAVETYSKGLVLSQKHKMISKTTDLTSKIAQTYNASGNTQLAQGYFSNSLNLASQENKKRALTEKIRVADFQNTNKSYTDEIELRKEVVQDLQEIVTQNEQVEEFEITADDNLNIQKQHYKIGKAYYQQKKYASAIPYLKKSIAVEDSKSDIIVKKEAIKKLSEVYRDVGQFDKALSAYQNYTELLETINKKKEQEINQAKQFTRELTKKQNRITTLEANQKLSLIQYRLSNEQNKRQQLIIYSLIFGLLLLLLAAYLMFRNIKQQRVANHLLALKSLRTQMNPHFIFNALNSVNSFISHNDEKTANKYLTDFSRLMRSVLENSEQDLIPLEKEIELLKLYLELEHFRFQDKFAYRLDIDETIPLNEFLIPPMLLQPYIENAVWHGLRYKKSKGKLEVSIHYNNNNQIKIEISDNGIGRKKSKALKTKNQKKKNSKGMHNINKRVKILNRMYKNKISVFVNDLFAPNTQTESSQEFDSGTKVEVFLKKIK